MLTTYSEYFFSKKFEFQLISVFYLHKVLGSLGNSISAKSLILIIDFSRSDVL